MARTKQMQNALAMSPTGVYHPKTAASAAGRMATVVHLPPSAEGVCATVFERLSSLDSYRNATLQLRLDFVRHVAREALQDAFTPYLDTHTLIQKVAEAFLTAMSTSDDSESESADETGYHTSNSWSPSKQLRVNREERQREVRTMPPPKRIRAEPPAGSPERKKRQKAAGGSPADKRKALLQQGRLAGCNCSKSARNPHHNLVSRHVSERLLAINPGKSRCLKLYCECYAGQQLCNAECNCTACANTGREEHAGLLATADAKRALVAERYKRAAGRPGCSCVKSFCLRKYCECFRADTACSDTCMCLGCENNFGVGGRSPGEPWKRDPWKRAASLSPDQGSDLY